MSNSLPEKRVLLRLLARRRDRRYRDEDGLLAMLVVEDQIRAAGAGTLAKREREYRPRGEVYRRKETSFTGLGYKYVLGVNRPAHQEREWPEMASPDFSSFASTASTMTIRIATIPAVVMAINVSYYSHEKRDRVAAKLWEARRQLRQAIDRARGD